MLRRVPKASGARVFNRDLKMMQPAVPFADVAHVTLVASSLAVFWHPAVVASITVTVTVLVARLAGPLWFGFASFPVLARFGAAQLFLRGDRRGQQGGLGENTGQDTGREKHGFHKRRVRQPSGCIMPGTLP
jgi:hypothetical protein